MMIRWLYEIEDQLFYASLPVDGPARQRLEKWSVRIGKLGDLMRTLSMRTYQ
jgi:hypothetical protein